MRHVSLRDLQARQGKEPSAWLELHEGPEASRCDQNTEHASGKSQDCTLGQTLAHQATTARPESYAHCKFTLARNRARQEEASHIGASNQQHQAYSAEKQPECRSDISNTWTQRRCHKAASRVGIRVWPCQLVSNYR